MATTSRGWQSSAAAVTLGTLGVTLPVVCGDVLAVAQVMAAFARVAVALPW